MNEKPRTDRRPYVVAVHQPTGRERDAGRERRLEAALHQVKSTALSAKSAPAALAHIVRLCIDALKRRDTGRVVNTMDLSPAAEHGELRFLLRDWENPHDDPALTARRAARALDELGFDGRDFLVLVGNPVLIGLVAALAYERTAGLRVLQWDRPSSRYLPVTINLGEVVDALDAA